MYKSIPSCIINLNVKGKIEKYLEVNAENFCYLGVTKDFLLDKRQILTENTNKVNHLKLRTLAHKNTI